MFVDSGFYFNCDHLNKVDYMDAETRAKKEQKMGTNLMNKIVTVLSGPYDQTEVVVPAYQTVLSLTYYNNDSLRSSAVNSADLFKFKTIKLPIDFGYIKMYTKPCYFVTWPSDI